MKRTRMSAIDLPLTLLAGFLALSASAVGCIDVSDPGDDDSLAPGAPDAPDTWAGWRELSADEATPVQGGIQVGAPGSAGFYVDADGRVFRTDEHPAVSGDSLELPASELAAAAFDDEAVKGAGPSGVVFGIDNRVPYTSNATLTGFNKRTIGHLTIDFGPLGGFDCTGSLVGPRHVLTAAHCLIGPFGILPQVSGIGFSPGERGPGFGNTRPNGAVRKANGFFLRSDNDIWDYALIILEDKQETADLGFMGLRWMSDDDWYEGRTISIVGYPGSDLFCMNAPGSTFPDCGGFMYGMQCEIDDASEDLEYECDTQPGQSGAPVYTWINDSPTVIGVHRGYESSPFSDWNKGVRFDHTKMGDLCSWIGNTQSQFVHRTCLP